MSRELNFEDGILVRGVDRVERYAPDRCLRS